MFFNKSILKYLKLIIVLSICCATFVSAQDRSIEINVNAGFKPVTMIGLLMTDGRTIQKSISKSEQISADVTMLTIPYQPEEVDSGTMATAMLIGPEGEVAMGDVKLITGSRSTKSFHSLPECSDELNVPPGLSDQVGLLESLVEIRSARREGNQLRISQIMSGPFLEKLRRLEKGFGMKHATKLSEDLTAFELVDRLSRLSNAIKNYQTSKQENQ